MFVKRSTQSEDGGRTTPIGLARYANEFFLAAKIVNQYMRRNKNFAPIPAMYLYAHSIELSLKSFLLSKKFSLDCLKKIGHDLLKLKNCALSFDGMNFQLNCEECSAIGILNKLYKTKQLNYIVTGYVQFPAYKYCESGAKKILTTTSKSSGWRCNFAIGSGDSN